MEKENNSDLQINIGSYFLVSSDSNILQEKTYIKRNNTIQLHIIKRSYCDVSKMTVLKFLSAD